jgi:hypothetical protein
MYRWYFPFGSTAQFRPWPPPWNFSVSLQLLNLGQPPGLLGQVISSSQGLYLYTNTEKRAHNTNIHARCGIRTHEHSVRASEGSLRLRTLGCRDRHTEDYLYTYSQFLSLLSRPLCLHVTCYLLPWGSSQKLCTYFLFPPIRVAFPAHVIPLDKSP